MDSVNYELFADRLKRSMDWEENSLDILVDNLNKNLSTILDEVALEHSKTVTQRMKAPWFMEEVRMLKHKLRRREKIWRKYSSHEHWLTYIDTRAEYRKLLKSEKSIIISNKVIWCGKDLKQLYSLVNNLMGTKQRILCQKTELTWNWQMSSLNFSHLKLGK